MVYSAPITQAPCSEKQRRNARIFECWRSMRLAKTFIFWRPRDLILDLIFGPLDVVLGAWTPTWDPFWHFGGPGCQNGRFWGSLWAPPGVHFGHILDTKSQRKLQKHEKVGVWKRSLKKAEKQHFTNRVWSGPERHPIDACRCFREVRWDALGIIFGRLWGRFLEPFW